VHVVAGVIPLRSHKAALFMKNKVAGMSVPDELVDVYEGRPTRRRRA
jgi:5,10-methylenetetrahydrofolate reductase